MDLFKAFKLKSIRGVHNGTSRWDLSDCNEKEVHFQKGLEGWGVVDRAGAPIGTAEAEVTAV